MEPTGPLVRRFSADLWESSVDAAWVFLTLPVADADEIAEMVPERRGFGSVRVHVTIGDTEWDTSIFPDKAAASYVLPVKRSVRNAERIDVGDEVAVTLEVVLD